MPDTLPQEWTWECVPEWERSVLQVVSIELSELRGVRCALASPSIDVNRWYGMKIWKPRWLGFLEVKAGVVYCLNNVLLVRVGDEQGRFDLFEPDSINKIVEMIRRTMGC